MAKSSSFRFRKHDTIGNPSAESDQVFLSKSFVDTGALRIITDLSDQRSIVLGRTGTGKTALIERLVSNQERIARIDPHNIALSYLSNSTVFRFFEAVGVSMDPFYRFLWKHVFVTELLRMRFDLHTDNASRHPVAELIRSLLRNQSHKDAFEYLESWGANFISNTEEQIREVTKRIENDLSASVSAGLLEEVRLGADGAHRLTDEMKIDIHHRGQDVLSTLQISKLNSLFDALDEDILDDPKKEYFVVVDRLDEEWVSDSMRFRLIRSLIEVVRDINSKVGPAKVVIALRVDLFDAVLRETTDAGFQGEKYRGLCLPLEWQRSELVQVVDLRISQLVRSRWTGQAVTHTDIFPGTVGKKKREKPLDYMIDRTLMRPRDIIAFVNDCIGLVANEPAIHPTVIDRTEARYSEQRLRSLADEWSLEYPFLYAICGLMKKRVSGFGLGEINDEQLDQLCLIHADKIEGFDTDDGRLMMEYVDGHLTAPDFRAQLAQILYKVGAIGMKPESYNQLTWVYSGSSEIPLSQIDDESKIYPHKMLWRALGIAGYP